MLLRTVVRALAVPLLAISCSTEGPAGPSPVHPVTPGVVLEVDQASCCNRSNFNASELPWISYGYCGSLRLVGARSITYSQSLTVYDEHGAEIFSRIFDSPATLEAGFVKTGCGGSVRHSDVARTGHSYALRIEYTTDNGTSGAAEGRGTYRHHPPLVSGIVISKFRPRGPNGSGDQFIELTNVSSDPIDVSGWFVHTSKSGATVGQSVHLDNFYDFASSYMWINPGCSFLISTGGFNPPPNSGVPGDNGMSAVLTDTIGFAIRARGGQIVDQVGMSDDTFFKEGTPLEPFGAVNSDRAYVRTADTGDNRRDFQMRSPSAPRRISMCNR